MTDALFDAEHQEVWARGLGNGVLVFAIRRETESRQLQGTQWLMTCLPSWACVTAAGAGDGEAAGREREASHGRGLRTAGGQAGQGGELADPWTLVLNHAPGTKEQRSGGLCYQEGGSPWLIDCMASYGMWGLS